MAGRAGRPGKRKQTQKAKVNMVKRVYAIKKVAGKVQAPKPDDSTEPKVKPERLRPPVVTTFSTPTVFGGFSSRWERKGALWATKGLVLEFRKKLWEATVNATTRLQQVLRYGTPRGLGHPNRAGSGLCMGWTKIKDARKMEVRVVNQTTRGNTPYIYPVELGRKPAPIPYAPLVEWILKKMKTLWGSPWDIAAKISEKAKESGMPGQGFVKRIFAEEGFKMIDQIDAEMALYLKERDVTL